MPVITPDALEADAVLPQCLDNQFVSEKVLDEMLNHKVLYDDKQIIAARARDTQTEFVRSLLYSSQVVVNRAYFSNSHYMRSQQTHQADALAYLIDHRAIVPYLHKAKSFDEAGEWAPLPGEDATRFRDLLSADAASLRLSVDDDENTSKADKLGSNFEQFCMGMISLAHREAVVQPMAHQLYTNSSFLDRANPGALPLEILKKFSAYLKELGEFTVTKAPELASEGKQFGREHVYQKFFIVDGIEKPKNTPLGAFKEELKTDPALRMLKKLVDLKYNANLPDLLKRYTLTPASLPGRSALPYDEAQDGDHGSASETLNILGEFKRAVMDNPPPVVLPRLRALELKDVQSIRMLKEWETFKLSQQKLLMARPDTLLNDFHTYHGDLSAFQTALGKWSLTHGPKAEQAGHICETALKLVVQIGSVFLEAHLTTGGHAFEGKLASKLLGDVEKIVPKICPQYCIKLLVSVTDTATGLINGDHAYQLELKRGGNIAREELTDMIKEIEKSNELPVASSSGLAEQAK
jgi:hypothetical protein